MRKLRCREVKKPPQGQSAINNSQNSNLRVRINSLRNCSSVCPDIICLSSQQSSGVGKGVWVSMALELALNTLNTPSALLTGAWSALCVPAGCRLVAPLRVASFAVPVHLPSSYPSFTCQTWGFLPFRRAGLNNCQKPTTAGVFPALVCLPSGGATLPRSSTKQHQTLGKGLQPRKDRTSLARA